MSGRRDVGPHGVCGACGKRLVPANGGHGGYGDGRCYHLGCSPRVTVVMDHETGGYREVLPDTVERWEPAEVLDLFGGEHVAEVLEPVGGFGDPAAALFDVDEHAPRVSTDRAERVAEVATVTALAVWVERIAEANAAR